MAAEVPAKDVLCEAMEYLSKLGSNLRTRSENLKEKKIRRDKLNNVLAVQKAASKVLLICELSKKSLQNVETGVRRVLELIDTSQASSSNGGKISQAEKDLTCKTKYYYFEYKARKLKIKNRISFKHYNSVRVYAKMLPKSMIDKYPVHYDCKLYRMRRKKEEELKEVEEPNKKKVKENSIENDASIISIPDTQISKSESKSNKNNSDTNLNNDVSIISIPDSPESKLDDSNKTGKLLTKNKSPRKSSIESTKDRSASRDGAQSPNKKSDTPENHRSRGKDCRKKTRSSNSEDEMKSSKRRRMISDSSSDAEKNSNVNSEKKENDSVSKCNVSDGSCHESNSKKQRHKEESNNDSKLLVDQNIAENDTNKNDNTLNEAVKPMIKCVSLSKLLKPDVVKNEKVRGPHSKPKDGSNKVKQHEKSETVESGLEQLRKEEEEYASNKRKEVESFKPKNFVINVMRLPELTLEFLNKLCLKKITQGGITICEIPDENLDEADAEQKDKNRTAKSKKIYEKEKGSNESKSNSRRASSNSSNDDDLIAEANKVKNSLLKESDSDDAIGSDNESKSSKKESESIKSTLLNDSDSETKKSDDGLKSNQDKVNNESDSETVKARKALCNDSDSESDKNEPKSTSQIEKSDIALRNTPDSDSEHKKTNSENGAAAEKISDRSNSKDDNMNENGSDDSVKKYDENLSECKKNEKTPEKAEDSINSDKAKSSLLDDSSDDKTRTPLSQRLTPQSKKKRMRESIQAKKMLLTYSSSDTEDEQLKIVLKDIKESLLHGSDDENKKKQLKESSLSSSGEDVGQVKEKITYDDIRPSKKRRPKPKRIKNRRRLDSEDSTKYSDVSNSSSSKVRSKK